MTILLLASGLLAWPQPDSPPDLIEMLHSAVQKRGKVQLDLFVMLDCPYGIEVERILLPLAMEFPDKVNLKVRFLSDVHDEKQNNSDVIQCQVSLESGLNVPEMEPKINSLAQQLRIQILIREYLPERFGDYLSLWLRSSEEIDWREIARGAGIEPEMVEAWLQAGEAEELLKADIARGENLGIVASPTLLIEGWEYDGILQSSQLPRSLCEALELDSDFCRALPRCFSDLDCPQPLTYCQNGGASDAQCLLRPDTPVTLTVLGDRLCQTCVSPLILDSARYLLPRLSVQAIEIESASGESLARALGVDRLPVYLFDFRIEDASLVFEKLKPILIQTDFGYLVDPSIHERPLFWKRPLERDALDLWFHPGEPASDEAELWWREYVQAATPEIDLRVHFWIDNPTEALQPHYNLVPSASGELLLKRYLTPEQSEILSRYQAWGLGWKAIQEDAKEQSDPGFLDSRGGSLVRKQIWFPGWHPSNNIRIFRELSLPLNQVTSGKN